ncbi:MAG: hypothetical protein HY313_08395 [Acidobacteria bacterium]|nr:hypothetical protein [Acidobacteriota bacterium]
MNLNAEIVARQDGTFVEEKNFGGLLISELLPDFLKDFVINEINETEHFHEALLPGYAVLLLLNFNATLYRLNRQLRELVKHTGNYFLTRQCYDLVGHWRQDNRQMPYWQAVVLAAQMGPTQPRTSLLCCRMTEGTRGNPETDLNVTGIQKWDNLIPNN